MRGKNASSDSRLACKLCALGGRRGEHFPDAPFHHIEPGPALHRATLALEPGINGAGIHIAGGGEHLARMLADGFFIAQLVHQSAASSKASMVRLTDTARTDECSAVAARAGTCIKLLIFFKIPAGRCKTYPLFRA